MHVHHHRQVKLISNAYHSLTLARIFAQSSSCEASSIVSSAWRALGGTDSGNGWSAPVEADCCVSEVAGRCQGG